VVTHDVEICRLSRRQALGTFHNGWAVVVERQPGSVDLEGPDGSWITEYRMPAALKQTD
jgi:hypothetical protein